MAAQPPSNPYSDHQQSQGVDHAEKGRGGHRYDYGGNPLAREDTSQSMRFPAFGGELQPGAFSRPKGRKLANPAPLGLSAFALTTFLLSLINLGTRGTSTPNIVVAAAYGYGECQTNASDHPNHLLMGTQVVLSSSSRACGKLLQVTPSVLLHLRPTVVSGLPSPSSLHQAALRSSPRT